MNEIHGTAARGFQAAADVYERARPGYPDGAVDFALASLGNPQHVLDLGAGTGKFTRALVARGVRCTAVEPVEGMRARLAAELPDVECLPGSAEAIPLPDRTVAAIVVAQAFHWFKHDDALAEMHRVLADRGRFALVWNVRDESVPWVRAVTEIIAPYEADRGVKIPRHRQGVWREALASTPLFRQVAETELPHEQQMDPTGLVERVLSTSFIADLPEDERARVVERVLALTEEPPLRGQKRFGFPYVTEVSVYEAC